MDIKITRSDLIWSYIAKVFSLSTGLIIMPFILNMLTAEEVGMNYLMITVSSIVMLIDFGFGPQFGKNFTYVNSGAQALLREGVQENNNGIINYHLLAVLLKTAKQVYRRLSIAALILMLTLGSFYIYNVTEGFKTVKNSQWIWIIYSFSVYFNFYYSYYTTLLTGSGMIAEASKATIITRMVQIILNILMLYMNYGLFAVVISNLLAPFAERYYCYRKYFTPELKKNINLEIHQEELNQTFNIIWYNAKKMGINLIGSYAINKLGLFLIGLYLPLYVVGSFGLLIQVSSILAGVAIIMFNNYTPMFAKYRVNRNYIELKQLFSYTVILYWGIMILGSLIIVLYGNTILNIISSNTLLPSELICFFYLFIITLEYNHSIFASFITTNNEVPFVKAGIVSGIIIAVLIFLGLQFFNFNLLDVVLVQGLIQLVYNNWYWPRYVLKDLKCNIKEFIGYGFSYIRKK